MFIVDADPLLDQLSFHYFVPHTASALEDASPFQLISPGISETKYAFALIAESPRDVTDLIHTSEDIVTYRMAGRGLSVTPLPVTLLEEVLPQMSLSALTVVVSATEGIAEQTVAVIKTCVGPVLHVSPAMWRLDRSLLREYALTAASFWKDRPSRAHHAKAIIDGLTNWTDPLKATQLPLMDRKHLLTWPNYSALRSAGFQSQDWDRKPLVGTDNEPYYKALKESIDAIVAIRDGVAADHPAADARSRVDLILTSPGVVKHWRQSPRHNLPSSTQSEARLVNDLLRQIVTRDNYNFLLQVPDGSNAKTMFDSEIVQQFLSANLRDLEVYTAMVSIRAASSFSPVLRLPTSVNGAHQEISQLASAVRSDKGGSPHKLNRLTRTLSKRLARNLPEWIFERLKASQRIKLISDAPLEWLPIDGFPLMLRADVSRVSVTPGNMFVQQTLRCSEMALPASHFQDVLVLRSFAPDDPLRSLLALSMDVYKAAGNFPKVRVKDVSTRDELIAALNDFHGAILVYDGHGKHDSSDIGHLALEKEDVNPWSLRQLARVPPIVILSACDTQPFGASHATSANGFLAAGAHTVVGTSVPIEGKAAAIFAARLLFRVGSFLPLLINRPWRSFRWSEVFPGLQRRQYTSEVLRRLTALNQLSLGDKEMMAIETSVGMAIDTGKEWLQLLLDHIAKAKQVSSESAKQLVLNQAAFVEALVYTQYGNPELVVGFEG
ncbi:MAG: CHAT domain-containing protein [Phycisphaeraceae bacterium]|nr:CHAT domain-containing protein [Phycisphaeraceae bacterium]